MITTQGLGKGPNRGSLVAWGLCKTQAIIFEQERKVILVRDNRTITLSEANRLLELEGSPLDRVIELVGTSNVIELSLEDRVVLLAKTERVIVVNTEDRTVELTSEAD